MGRLLMAIARPQGCGNLYKGTPVASYDHVIRRMPTMVVYPRTDHHTLFSSTIVKLNVPYIGGPQTFTVRRRRGGRGEPGGPVCTDMEHDLCERRASTRVCARAS